MYFAKITASWTPKNSLQRYLKNQVEKAEKVTVEDPKTVYQFLQSHVALANRTYIRCTKEEITMRQSAFENGDYFIESSVFQITFYKQRGLFSPQVTNSKVPTGEHTQSETSLIHQPSLFD